MLMRKQIESLTFRGPRPLRVNWAAVGLVAGLLWWIATIGSMIAADLSEHSPRRPNARQARDAWS
jgi:hypothetical protein